MLRQVFDWAASRSTELLTRYKQMATNIGFSDNVNSYEYSEMFQEMSMKASEEFRLRGRKTQRDQSEEPYQPCFPSKKRRRRQCHRQENSSGSVPVNVATGHGAKQRCSPTGRTSDEVPVGTECLVLGGLTLSLSRRIRLPLTNAIHTSDDPECPDKETYAQIVKTPKAARDEWIKELNKQTEIMTTELDKWRSRFRVFSVSVEVTGATAGELGDSKDQDSLKHQILVQRLKKKLRDYFGQIVLINELVVWQDGTKHKSVHLGPTEDALEREMHPGKSSKKTNKIGHRTQKEVEVFQEKSGPAAPTVDELEDSFSGIEDKFWSKQDHYLKRKSGKASRKRLRVMGPSTTAVPSKKEMAHSKAESDAKLPLSDKCKFEIQNKRSLELAARKVERRDAACCITENPNASKSLKPQFSGPDYETECLPKRLELMHAKYRRFMKKMEKTKRDGKLQTGNLRR